MLDQEKNSDQLFTEIRYLRNRVDELEKLRRLETVESVARSDLKLLEIIENTTESIIAVDKARIVFANPASSYFTGYSIDELSRIPDVMTLVFPDDREVINESFKIFEPSSMAPHNFEFRFICKDGSLKWVEVHTSVVKWEDKQVLLCFMNDINDRKKIERQLIEKSIELAERVKEATCLYRIYKLTQTSELPLNEILSGIIDLIPSGMQFPEATRARIFAEGQEYKTVNHVRCDLIQSEQIIVNGQTIGFLEVGLLQDQLKGVDVRFLEQERLLIEAISSHISEVIDKRRSEGALRIRSRAIETSINGIRMVSPDGMVIYSNESSWKMWGYESAQDINGVHISDLFKDKLEYQKAEFEVVEKGYFSGALTALRKNGTTFEALISINKVKDEHGNLLCYVASQTDITEQKRSEENYKRLFTAIEYSAGSVVVTDPQGNIQYVNPAFEKTTGYTSKEVMGKNPRILKSGKHDNSFYQQLWGSIINGSAWHGVLINRKKDGSLIQEEASISPVKDSAGNIINYVRVSRDVTKEIDLQRQLIQSQRMEAIGTLAGGIAHDFNNILFAITGNTELAIQTITTDDRLSSYLSRVLEAANRARDMVQQILAFSRHDKPERQPLDISPVIKESIKFLRASIPPNIEIKQNIQPNLPRINGDPTQIHQILINLCVNASHAMDRSNGILEISLCSINLDREFVADRISIKAGDYINLTVRDTGSGMTPGIMDHVFEPYFTTKKKGEGTGFGLSIVHNIVQNHGGFVTVQSDLGKGSSFNVYLPIIEECFENQLESQETSPIVGGHEKILLVDDESVLTDVGKSIFESLGYQVEAFTDPVEALKAFEKSPGEFDLIFTDLAMPKISGDVLTQKIRAIRQDVPVIFCTGLSQSFSEDWLNNLGVRAVIEKPLLKKDMARVVRTVLDSRS
ncbi:MAG: PAS domain S-box protein [Syntrophaceae bacterium]|nr:PAS domain S-box protein [Syntrophaceae bacterium]